MAGIKVTTEGVADAHPQACAREVRANVAYRSFCRIGMEKVPDEKTLIRLGQAIGPETIRELPRLGEGR